MDEWSSQPSEAGGNVAGQGNGVALDVDAAIGLVKAPVGIQAPQKSVVIFRRGRMLLRGAGVLDFRDSSAVRNGCGVGAVHGEVLDFVFGIQDDGEDVGFFYSQENVEGISCARQESGAKHCGTVVIGVAIIILKGCESLL